MCTGYTIHTAGLYGQNRCYVYGNISSIDTFPGWKDLPRAQYFAPTKSSGKKSNEVQRSSEKCFRRKGT